MKTIATFLTIAALTACAPMPNRDSAMTLQSGAFTMNAEIPRQYTCEGTNISPPLTWSHVPAGTKSFALIMDDPGIAQAGEPAFNFVHWVLYNLPANTTELPEAIKALPSGTGEGLNGMNATGYGGPCPPSGRHRYFHTLYALDIELPKSIGKPTKTELVTIMKGHVLATAQLLGTYEKQLK